MVGGTAGNDILVSGNGDDNLNGNDENDTTDSGIKSDILIGGLGEAKLLRNESNDIFGFYAPSH